MPHCDPVVNEYDLIYGTRNDRVEAVWPVRREGSLNREEGVRTKDRNESSYAGPSSRCSSCGDGHLASLRLQGSRADVSDPRSTTFSFPCACWTRGGVRSGAHAGRFSAASRTAAPEDFYVHLHRHPLSHATGVRADAPIALLEPIASNEAEQVDGRVFVFVLDDYHVEAGQTLKSEIFSPNSFRRA